MCFLFNNFPSVWSVCFFFIIRFKFSISTLEIVMIRTRKQKKLRLRDYRIKLWRIEIVNGQFLTKGTNYTVAFWLKCRDLILGWKEMLSTLGPSLDWICMGYSFISLIWSTPSKKTLIEYCWYCQAGNIV